MYTFRTQTHLNLHLLTKENAQQLCIKIAVQGWLCTTTLIQGTIALAGATSGCREGAPLPELTEKPLHFLRIKGFDAPSLTCILLRVRWRVHHAPSKEMLI